MKHRIPHSWSIRLPVSVHTHTPIDRNRKRFLACARNDMWEKIAPHSLSYHSHPIRPCGAPSPRGEGFDTRIPSSPLNPKPNEGKAKSTSLQMSFKSNKKGAVKKWILISSQLLLLCPFLLLVVKNKRKRAYFPLSPKNQLFKIKLPYPYVPVASYGICTGWIQ